MGVNEGETSICKEDILVVSGHKVKTLLWSTWLLKISQLDTPLAAGRLPLNVPVLPIFPSSVGKMRYFFGWAQLRYLLTSRGCAEWKTHSQRGLTSAVAGLGVATPLLLTTQEPRRPPTSLGSSTFCPCQISPLQDFLQNLHRVSLSPFCGPHYSYF